MRTSSLRLDVPAVFLFEPTMGQPVSLNNSASRLLHFLALSEAPRITLAAIERGLAADARISTISAASGPIDGVQSELRRECRRADGCIYVLTRVWAPGSNTILTVEDVTARVVEMRGRRLARILLRRIAAARDADDAANAVLRSIQLYTGWTQGELRLMGDGGLVAVAERGGRSLITSVDRTISEDLPHSESFVTIPPEIPGAPPVCAAEIPLIAGAMPFGIMNFSSTARATDEFSFGVVCAAAPLVALALAGKRDQDLLRMVKQGFSKTYVVPMASVDQDIRGTRRK